MEDDAKNEKIRFLEHHLKFYFNGEYSESVGVTGISDAELNEWIGKTILFLESFEEGFDIYQKLDYFSVVEELYSAAWIEYSSGSDIDGLDLDDIGEGYDFDRSFFEKNINAAVSIIREYGVDLTGKMDDHQF